MVWIKCRNDASLPVYDAPEKKKNINQLKEKEKISLVKRQIALNAHAQSIYLIVECANVTFRVESYWLASRTQPIGLVHFVDANQHILLHSFAGHPSGADGAVSPKSKLHQQISPSVRLVPQFISSRLRIEPIDGIDCNSICIDFLLLSKQKHIFVNSPILSGRSVDWNCH